MFRQSLRQLLIKWLFKVPNVSRPKSFAPSPAVTPRQSGEGLWGQVRRVVLKLKKPTRNCDNEIAILTMLPTPKVPAAVVTELYRERRSVENLFQSVTENYTLGYPKAALFSFCLALVAYNILATVRGV